MSTRRSKELNDNKIISAKYLNIMRKGNKNANQKSTLANINIFYNARNNAIKFIEDYRSMILEAKKLAIEEQEGNRT